MALIDSSIIRAHQHAAGGKKGSGSHHRPFSWRTEHEHQCRRRRRRTANPLGAEPGQAFDKEAAAPMIASLSRTRDLVADRGYDAQYPLDLAPTRGVAAHITTQRGQTIQRSVDKSVYRCRNLVECFFSKLKHFRRVAPALTSEPATSSPPSPSPQSGRGPVLMSPRPRTSRHATRAFSRNEGPKADIQRVRNGSTFAFRHWSVVRREPT